MSDMDEFYDELAQCYNDKVFSQALQEQGAKKYRANSGYTFSGFRLLTDAELAAREEKAEAEEAKEMFA